MNPKDKMAAMIAQPDQGQFLQSEKDLRPHWETERRGMFWPIARNGYNNARDWAMPEALGGHGASVMKDIVDGKPLTTDEINHGAQGAANFMLTGGLAGNIGKRPQAGVMSSSGAQPPKLPLIPEGTFPSQTGLQSAMRQQGLRSHPSYEADVPVGSIRPLQPPSDMDPAKVAGLVGNFPPRDVNVSPELGVSLYRHGDQYYTMDGHHRAEAARQRGDATLPALVRDIYSNPKQGATVALAENAAKNLSGAQPPKAVSALNEVARQPMTPGKLPNGQPLMMDKASRMARAEAMGFDVANPVYHGTNATFDAFKRPNNFDHMSSEDSIFFTTDPGLAAMYGGVKPYALRGRIDDAKMPNPDRVGFEHYDEVMNDAAMTAELSGSTGVRFLHHTGKERDIAVFDPTRIRSLDAAFDPAFVNSANLLAANPRQGATAPLAENAAKNLSSSGAQPPKGIRAYHGSPHEFDKFDLSKIGSGKGANHYGTGIYLAESEAFAKGYKPSNGRMYEVNVKADPADLLDWDKPLSGQSNKVRDAISGYASNVKSDVGGWDSGKPLSYYLPSGNGRAITMADTLKSAGVPGIRYSDGVEGGSNYVIFDDKLIDITRMYANPRQGATAPLAENAAKRFDPMNPLGPVGSSAPSRDVDGLGYYSAALEAAKSWPQGKGSLEQALAWMTKNGTKQAEIDATGVGKAFSGPVTRDDLVKYLGENRVGVRETIRGSGDAFSGNQRIPLDEAFGGSKFSSYSLDPSNPTYRETVLSLPRIDKTTPFQLPNGGWALRRGDGTMVASKYAPDKPFSYISRAEAEKALKNDIDADYKAQDFRSGHFPEPNIVGHMMSSLNKHEGKPVYTLDQIQSDWGQKLRDGGVRDEAKIAELKAAIAKTGVNPMRRARGESAVVADLNAAESQLARETASGTAWPSTTSKIAQLRAELADISNRPGDYNDRAITAQRLLAELRTAEASASGHPLVNTTDQWTNTTLRRGLQQAIDAEAEYMAIPSGKTVLGYNPGNEHGMETFYNQIVPKNLGNILSKLDKAGAAKQFVQQLETPSGMKGDGFSVFQITPAMREQARKGLPLFINPQTAAIAPLAENAAKRLGTYGAGSSDALNRVPYMPMDQASRMERAKSMGFDTDTTWYHGSNEKLSEIKPGMRDPGAWFTTDLMNASNYARGENATIHDTRLKTKNPFVVEAGTDGAGGFVPMHNGQPLDLSDNVAIVKRAQQLGYDSVHFPDGNFSESGNTMVVFDPSQIRSTSAKFRTDQESSGKLMAANPATGAVVPLAGNAFNEERPSIDEILRRYDRAY